MAQADSESSLYQHALELDGELARERAKVDRLESSPPTPTLDEEYKHRYPTGWFSDTRPLPPLTLASLPPRN
ncbi:hypothetical protein LIER_23285 [Lithospermum erythrorhizon]|uniref:Uncharacterized protein n=1 Tax=Lithospermum erythrorhizon TaxID=34254 RepID=A0AAV3QY87_LITER